MNQTDLRGVVVLTGLHLCVSALPERMSVTPTRAGHFQVTTLSTLAKASLCVPPNPVPTLAHSTRYLGLNAVTAL